MTITSLLNSYDPEPTSFGDNILIYALMVIL